MSLTRFAGRFNALAFAYGVQPEVGPLQVSGGAVPSGAQTLSLEFGFCTTGDGVIFFPLNVNAPITIGSGANGETVTPTSIAAATPTIYNTSLLSATFANAHGTGDLISSGSYGLQEAINYVASQGGGSVVTDARWTALGGTTAMLAAAVLPANGSVVIEDRRVGGFGTWGQRSTGAALAAPAAATSATAASQVGVVGTWTAATTHVRFTYVTADGGETLMSADYSFTATVNLAIGGSGPAAVAGAVGYRVYIGSVSTGYLAPLIAANGTVIQCGPIQAFQIGTPFSIATATTSALPLGPTVSTAFAVTVANSSLGNALSFPPFANVGAISAATETSLSGPIQLPTGYLNTIGRTVRIKGTAVITTNSATGTITIAINLWSAYGVSAGKITPFTVACPSTAMGGAVVNCQFEALLTVTAVGATGTVEMHGYCLFNLAGTAVGTLATDFISVASSAVDLTKQDSIEVTVTTATVAPTAGTLRQLSIETLA